MICLNLYSFAVKIILKTLDIPDNSVQFLLDRAILNIPWGQFLTILALLAFAGVMPAAFCFHFICYFKRFLLSSFSEMMLHMMCKINKFKNN